ncbi:hypothetical protein BBF96_13285 [Anoxybacter fermentans]|uniref:M23ase beta-sheet core domain-containing protein n=1 Tax=Anoxybacter fermentans TaxID=1323375 RepID=A0A3Q9HTX0_9FIRM|nr:M23 family metallopeptidase [Anoxybacter fermentans]AZR74289.1 hypothetical protein BBF96_13285 [Anoxybacter fermentans]
MRWRRTRKRLKKYLFERLTLTLIPHSRGSMRSIRLPRIVFIFIILSLVAYFVSVTYLYQNYFNRYKQALDTIVSLQKLKTENMTLKTGLAQVAKETEKMRKILLELEKKGEHIESLISDTSVATETNVVKDLILFNYKLLDDEGMQPLGGGEGEGLLKSNGFELLSQIREELRMLRVEIPLQKSILEELQMDVEEYNALMAATPRGWPLDDDGKGYISSEFGFRKDPVTNEQAFHEGIDIAVWYGTPVLATADGKVIYAGWKSGYGKVVIIDHGYGYQTVYGHNSKLVVRKGQRVKRGDIIAYSGNSGKSTGPHLHYEVRVNGVPKNPIEFIKFR